MFKQKSPAAHSALVGHMTPATSDSYSQAPFPEVSWAAAKICFVPPANTAAFCAIRFSREAMPGPFERHSAALAVIAARCPSFPAFSPATKSFEGLRPGELGPYALAPKPTQSGRGTYSVVPAGANLIAGANAEYRIPL